MSPQFRLGSARAHPPRLAVTLEHSHSPPTRHRTSPESGNVEDKQKRGKERENKMVSYLLAKVSEYHFFCDIPIPLMPTLPTSVLLINHLLRSRGLRNSGDDSSRHSHISSPSSRRSAHTAVQDRKHGALTRTPNPIYSAQTTLAYRILMLHVYHDHTTPLSSHICQPYRVSCIPPHLPSPIVSSPCTAVGPVRVRSPSVKPFLFLGDIRGKSTHVPRQLPGPAS
jgi:hypothetical protein